MAKEPKNQNKRFVIRKYVYALSAQEAIKLDSKAPVDDVWIDEDWKKEQLDKKGEWGFIKPKN